MISSSLALLLVFLSSLADQEVQPHLPGRSPGLGLSLYLGLTTAMTYLCGEPASEGSSNQSRKLQPVSAAARAAWDVFLCWLLLEIKSFEVSCSLVRVRPVLPQVAERLLKALCQRP